MNLVKASLVEKVKSCWRHEEAVGCRAVVIHLENTGSWQEVSLEDQGRGEVQKGGKYSVAVPGPPEFLFYPGLELVCYLRRGVQRWPDDPRGDFAEWSCDVQDEPVHISGCIVMNWRGRKGVEVCVCVSPPPQTIRTKW